MKRYILLPLRPAPLILVALFTVGLRLAIGTPLMGMMRLMGIPVAVILVSWFFKYCFVLLDAAIAGEDEPPVLSLEMVHPFDEQRPLAELVLIAVGCMIVGFVRSVAGWPGLILSGAVLLAALPASVAVLGISANPFHAASPVALAKLIRELGRHYAWLVLATLALGAGLYALVRADAPLVLTLAMGQLALLFVFALIGGAVHENRLMLGLSIRTREEWRAERELREHVLERRHMLDRSFAQLRLGRTKDSWSEIERWIAIHGRGERGDAEFDALIASTMKWEPPVVTDRLVSDYLDRLLGEQDNGRALETLARRLASHPSFRPARPEQAKRLRELAALAGNRALCRELDR
ncbi:MAG: hypothetical protein WBE92_17785 [Steroidobacteraceae bacterium]